MEVLVHFAFELIKIGILSSIYAFFVFITSKVISSSKEKKYSRKISKINRKSWYSTAVGIYVLLLIFMFTYYGDHGLGDSARIPIGHSKAVRQINGVDTYLQNDNGDQLDIKNFAYDNENLYAETISSFNPVKGNYIIWNLKTDKWVFYKTREDYAKAAKINKYPVPQNFKDFWHFYSKYWNGWRLWLLP